MTTAITTLLMRQVGAKENPKMISLLSQDTRIQCSEPVKSPFLTAELKNLLNAVILGETLSGEARGLMEMQCGAKLVKVKRRELATQMPMMDFSLFLS